ncbi:MAG: DUF4373 domain-containing protein [Mediterranea sp.]|jgi:hypothetical protein|nr:DUF4373 domain-containing protein [Mediterranea sp.]
MARAIKQGLDYFPLEANFAINPTVLQIKKEHGDATVDILIQVLSFIYTGEGYYVKADQTFCRKLAVTLYQTDAATVESVVRQAVELEMFDARLYAEQGILTSVEIQQQFLFSSRRRRNVVLETGICLLTQEQIDESRGRENIKLPAGGKNRIDVPNVDNSAQNVRNSPQNVDNGTHSIVQNSIEENRKENLPPQSPHLPERMEEGELDAADPSAGGGGGTADAGGGSLREGRPKTPAHPRGGREWTQADIDALRPPADGVERNLDGLRDNLLRLHVPPAEQYAIINLSNYGAKGGAVWMAFSEMRNKNWKPRLPGKYLLAVIQKSRH